MKEGKLSYIGKGNNFISIVHPKDVAKCLRLALERDKNGDIFNVVSFTCKIKEFFSTKKLYEGIMPLFALQNYDMKEIEENIFYFYKAMYEKFFREKHLIKDENYVEIRYEDFINQPLKKLKEIYDSINLPDFEKYEKRFKDYIAMQSNYKPRKYEISKEDKERIYSEWNLTIDKWGYE